MKIDVKSKLPGEKRLEYINTGGAEIANLEGILKMIGKGGRLSGNLDGIQDFLEGFLGNIRALLGSRHNDTEYNFAS